MKRSLTIVIRPPNDHRRPPCWLAVLVSLGFLPALAYAAPDELQRTLEYLMRNLPHATTTASACVIDIATGATLFDHRADLPMLPASNAKVFVMAAATKILGMDFAFETVFGSDGTNLYIVGGGDPGLGDEKLHRSRGETRLTVFEHWADIVKATKLGPIRGKLVIDESIFDGERIHQDWEANDLGKWFAAPVTGLNFNDNCLDITVSPGSDLDQLALVDVQPQNTLARILNQCESGGHGKPVLHHPPGTFDYHITGRCHRRWPFRSVAFPDPAWLAADVFLQVLDQKGVRFEGELVRKRVRTPFGLIPPSVYVLSTYRTPLADVLRRMGKDSQNLFAEATMKRLGYEWARQNDIGEVRGSWVLGARAISDVLLRANIETNHLVLSDGSGLSRSNRCTARQLAETLAWMQSQHGSEMFRRSLAQAGKDGSMADRLKGLPVTIFAKTGTMGGVTALSGYVDARAGRYYAFSILFNNYTGPSRPYRDIQDRFCTVLAGLETRPSHRRPATTPTNRR